MTANLVQFLRDRLKDDERAARAVSPGPWRTGVRSGIFVVEGDGWTVGSVSDLAGAHIARHDPARTLREVEAKRRMLDAHSPVLRTVEWPHDQNGQGEAQCCRSCGNTNLDAWLDWIAADKDAGFLPEGVMPPYVLAPCETLRVLALPYADHPDYRQEWRP